MDEIDLKRQKYNYVNTTKNIITCFSIVGYEINTIKDYILPKIDDYYEFSDDVLHEDKKILNTYPSILYSVVEENDKTGINKKRKKLIYNIKKYIKNFFKYIQIF